VGYDYDRREHWQDKERPAQLLTPKVTMFRAGSILFLHTSARLIEMTIGMRET
jgi:hypothetical protein